MNILKSADLPAGCALISLPKAVDDRGKLVFLQGGEHIPFPVERVFWICDVPEGKTRGGHAHWVCSEVVVPVAGGFVMRVDDGEHSAEVVMDDPSVGILIPAGMWCELTQFQPGTVCVVMASHPYDAGGYVNAYDEYVNVKMSRK